MKAAGGAERNVVFLDMAKAFDTVRHDVIDRALQAVGVPRTLRTAVMASVRHSHLFVRTVHGDSKAIAVTTGVVQGD